MSEPGWYPDPGGTPGHYRYWDGTTWSPTTSPTPQQPPTPPKKRPTGLIIGIIAATITLAIIAALTIPNLLNNNTNTTNPVETSAPTQTAWDETSTPTQTPPTGNTNTPENPQPTGGNPQNCEAGSPRSRQSSDLPGVIVGGSLAANQIPGWSTSTMDLSFAYDVQAQRTDIAVGWFNDIAVGALHIADGFDTPRQAAEIVMQCLASSDYYSGFTGRTDIANEAITISGKPGWRIRSEVRVTGHERNNIEGDVIEIIVVDPQKGEHLAFFQSAATIGRSDIQKLVDASAASLRVV